MSKKPGRAFALETLVLQSQNKTVVPSLGGNLSS